MKIVLLIFGMAGLAMSGFSQEIIFPYEENFEWQVKQIDEFMERFNNADYTPIRHFLKEEYDIEEIDRSDLLKTLFNLKQGWNKNHVMQFLKEVTQSKVPPYLDFYDKDWYAELDCKGTYMGKQRNFTLVLSIYLNARTRGAKWVINSVSADFLPVRDTSAPTFAMHNNKSRGSRTLNPASFGTDFMALVDALGDTANFRNYISRDEVDKSLLTFFDMLYQQKLVFQQVNHITYHFLQVPGWVFQVKDFPRQTTNSGWLISKLIPATEEEKEAYCKKTLYLSRN